MSAPESSPLGRQRSADVQTSPAVAGPRSAAGMLEIWLHGFPAGTKASLTGGSAPIRLRIGDAMPTTLTP